MQKSRAIFKLDHLKHYCIIDGPCTVKVRVGANVTESNKMDIGLSTERYLVPLRVGFEDKLKYLAKSLADGRIVPFKDVSLYFFTGAIFSNSIDDILTLPIKGEEIIATFDYIEDGRLMCTSLSLIPRIQLKMFDPTVYNKTKSLFNKIIDKSK